MPAEASSSCVNRSYLHRSGRSGMKLDLHVNTMVGRPDIPLFLPGLPTELHHCGRRMYNKHFFVVLLTICAIIWLVFDTPHAPWSWINAITEQTYPSETHVSTAEYIRGKDPTIAYEVINLWNGISMIFTKHCINSLYVRSLSKNINLFLSSEAKPSVIF